jgi:5-methylcytosine-specific restriction endonuclease McrA
MAKNTRMQVAELTAEGLTGRQIAKRLGVSAATVSYHRRRSHLPMNPKCARRHDWNTIQTYYDEGHSVRECIVKFGFSGKSWYDAVNRGAVVPRPQSMPIEQLLVNGQQRGRNHLKSRLFAAGLKENKCEDCGLFLWQGKRLSLALHHINGDGHDNRLENLALLCPNCHSQTPNFGVKNVARKAA